MDLIRLGDIATYINGYAFKPKDWREKGIPIIRIQNLNDPNKEYNYFDGEIDSKYLVNEGDILISWSASIGVYEWRGQQGVLNQHIFKVDFNKIKIDKKYFKYIVSIALNRALQYMHGSTMKHITKQYFDNILIPVPLFDQQIKIANILDQAQELIDKRKAQIEALDELIQSVFYDMFGDPIQNPKGFNKKAIGKEFEIKTGATPSRKDETYWDNGTIPWVKTTELKEVVIYDTDECITELGFNNSSVNLLPKNTLLIAMYGQGKTRGMTGKLGIEATTNQACAALLPTDKNNQDFIWIQLRCLYEELRNLGRGGNQPNLNTNLIKSFEILFPPIELQNQFAEIVENIEKQKELLNECLVELENNFNSLMQRAFSGEL